VKVDNNNEEATTKEVQRVFEALMRVTDPGISGMDERQHDFNSIEISHLEAKTHLGFIALFVRVG
jgi:hypothetical protein